jgi:hypothetical protein
MSFKTFDLAHDVASLASAVNEVVNVSSSLYEYPTGGSKASVVNVQYFDNIAASAASGGYWQTIFDSNPTSSQSTALFDLTFGFHPTSSFNASSATLPDEKVKVYRQMASMLLGDADARFSPGGATNWNECFFLMVKRGIMKDELKKGTVQLLLTGSTGVTASDLGAATSYKQSVGGDYANLVDTSSTGSSMGLVFYNAGIIVIPVASNDKLEWNYTTLPTPVNGATWYWKGSNGLASGSTAIMFSGTIDDAVDGLRNHVTQIAFHNQTNLYSTVYFCRATNTEFNYSSNPTYLDENSRIRVTSGSNVLQSRTYITTVGLYDASDNLLAVGKVNKPITKSPDTESIFRVRLDY